MNLAMLDVLDNTTNAVNAILALELETKKVVRQNVLATEYFYQRDGITDLGKLFDKDTDREVFFQEVLEELDEKDKVLMEDVSILGKTGEELECTVSFMYITDDYSHIFMKIHPIIDNKPYYLRKFIETRSRPAFTLDIKADLTINLANDIFYKSFACNEESMKIIYRNMFVNLLAQDSREDYKRKILDAVSGNPFAIVEIPIKTARGETMWLYFNKYKLKAVQEETPPNLFCLLVSQEDTIAEIDNPFDNI